MVNYARIECWCIVHACVCYGSFTLFDSQSDRCVNRLDQPVSQNRKDYYDDSQLAIITGSARHSGNGDSSFQ